MAPAAAFPRNTPRRHRPTLTAAYAPNRPIRPASIIPSDSSENVEKVVNPPQTPTLRKVTALPLSQPPVSMFPAMSPMTNAPTKFTVSVCSGKSCLLRKGIIPTRYLITEPMNPPAPAAMQFQNMLFSPFVRLSVCCSVSDNQPYLFYHNTGMTRHHQTKKQAADDLLLRFLI